MTNEFLFVTYDDDDDDDYGRGVAFELVASIIITLIDTSNSASFMGDYHEVVDVCFNGDRRWRVKGERMR